MERAITSIYDFASTEKANLLATAIRKERNRESLKSFSSVEHRMELVATIRGIDFINDSKATNINSTWYALESINKRIVLMLGGIDRNNDYSILTDLVQQKVSAIICIGRSNIKIIKAFKSVIPNMTDAPCMDTAVSLALRIAQKGEAVLLSPACASFDRYKNYEERGNKFMEAVKKL